LVKIVEKFEDVAKKWRVRVLLDDGSAIFLKFQKEPTEAEALVETDKYLANVVLEQEAHLLESQKKGDSEQKLDLVKDLSTVDLQGLVDNKEKLDLVKDVSVKDLKEKLKGGKP
jgi:hypothetical protein